MHPQRDHLSPAQIRYLETATRDQQAWTWHRMTPKRHPWPWYEDFQRTMWENFTFVRKNSRFRTDGPSFTEAQALARLPYPRDQRRSPIDPIIETIASLL